MCGDIMITVNADGKSGTMPDLDTGTTEVTFTIDKNKIMVEGNQIGTIKGVQANRMTVNIPSVGQNDLVFIKGSVAPLPDPDKPGNSLLHCADAE